VTVNPVPPAYDNGLRQGSTTIAQKILRMARIFKSTGLVEACKALLTEQIDAEECPWTCPHFAAKYTAPRRTLGEEEIPNMSPLFVGAIAVFIGVLLGYFLGKNSRRPKLAY